MLSVDELRADVETGAVDTVIAAFTDMQGRLMGKRLDAEFFLDLFDYFLSPAEPAKNSGSPVNDKATVLPVPPSCSDSLNA